MALIKFGPTISEARRSIGGVTFSRNRAGAYIRKRTKPVNPSTPKQQAVRNAVRNLQSRFRLTVTATQRQGWADLATGAPMKNRLGENSPISAVNMYVRLNQPRLLFAAVPIDIAPAPPAECALPTLTMVGTTAGGIVLSAPSPVIPAGGYLMAWWSNRKLQTRNYFKGPYPNSDLYDSTTMFPKVIVAGASLTIGDRWFFYFRNQDIQGRLSAKYTHIVDITA